jgi:hypothetical protein
MIFRGLIICGLLTTQIAFAAPLKKGMISDFSEDETKFVKNSDKKDLNKSSQKIIEAYKKKMRDGFRIEGKVFGGNIIAGRRTEAPGFMSSRQINPSAEVVGPIDPISIIRIGDTIYLRWTGTPGPQEGEVYATVTPALVMQNKEDATDFEIGVPQDMNQLPDRYHIAGYLYETTGWIRITKISQGLVEARVTSMRAQVSVGDRVMPTLPVFKEVPPVYGDGTLTATIVAGHPVERLSTTQGSYLYLNRGMRDGVKLGQMFIALDDEKLKIQIHENPKHLAGSVKVIYVSDAYSTAMISEQFDIIRIGSALRTQTANEAQSVRESTQQNFPNMEALPVSPENETAPTAPGEEQKSNGKKMSELDAIENSIKNSGLTSAERDRLNQLQKQTEKKEPPQAEESLTTDVPSADQNPAEEEKKSSDVPKLPPLENSFQKKDSGKKAESDKKKKAGKFRDEERLNEMMQ